MKIIKKNPEVYLISGVFVESEGLGIGSGVLTSFLPKSMEVGQKSYADNTSDTIFLTFYEHLGTWMSGCSYE